MKEAEVKCPNCGNPRLMLVLTETTETTCFISPDGKWMSKPVFNAYGKIAFHDVPKVLDSKVVLRCHYCGQENEAVLAGKGRFSTCISLGAETSHGASIK